MQMEPKAKKTSKKRSINKQNKTSLISPATIHVTEKESVKHNISSNLVLSSKEDANRSCKRKQSIYNMPLDFHNVIGCNKEGCGTRAVSTAMDIGGFGAT